LNELIMRNMKYANFIVTIGESGRIFKNETISIGLIRVLLMVPTYSLFEEKNV